MLALVQGLLIRRRADKSILEEMMVSSNVRHRTSLALAERIG